MSKQNPKTYQRWSYSLNFKPQIYADIYCLIGFWKIDLAQEPQVQLDGYSG